MITVLADHNLEGQARLLWRTLAADGWLELELCRLATFAEVSLPFDSTDRQIWRFVQAEGMLLLTANRNNKDKDSLERTFREENHPMTLPIITIANLDRFDNSVYRSQCATRLAEIIIYLDRYRGTGRQFIP